MAVVACWNQPGAAVAVGRLQIRPGLERGPHHLRVSVGRGDEERTVLLVVLRVDIRAAGDELLHALQVAALCRGDQLAIQRGLRMSDQGKKQREKKPHAAAPAPAIRPSTTALS